MNGAGIGTHGGAFGFGKFAAHQGHDLANRFAAGSVGCLDLVEKTPECHLQGEDAPAAVLALACAREQRLWDVGAENLAELGKGGAFRELRESLREGRDRRLAEKQGAEGLKEWCGVAHARASIYTCY